MSTFMRHHRWWVRTHRQPRDERGRFAKGFVLWTREWLDGAARWVWWETPEPDCWPGPRRSESITPEQGRIQVISPRDGPR